MTLYSIFIITSFILFYLNTIQTMRNQNLVTNARVSPIFPSSTGLVFGFTINNTSDDDDFNVELSGDRCCLLGDDDVNCDVLEVIGSCVGKIPRGSTRSMRMVAPILDPFERVGYCWFHLDSKSSKRRKKTMRNRLKTDFDTRIDNKDQPMIVPTYLKSCKGIDEDPFNDCNFVDCETYYNGKKSYFDRKLRKCSKIPVCKSNTTEDVVYDTNSNKCINKDLKKEDLEFVAQLVENKHRTTKDIIIISHENGPDYNTVKYPDVETEKITSTTAKFTFDEDRHLKYTTEPFSIAHEVSEKSNADHLQTIEKTCGDAKEIVMIEDAVHFQWFNTLVHGCSVQLLLLVTVVQCCCIFGMICFLPRPCSCKKSTKLIKSFLSYRQDASVTTPLIDTSNIDTETTHYTSESNIDKKIRCYKAFHKDVNVKTSLSDDILSKCITRRDWHSKSVKYPQEKFKTNSDICKIQERSEHEEELNVNEYKPPTNPVSKPQVIVEKEAEVREREKKSAIRKSLFRKLETKSDSEETVPKCDSSEKEIQSHVYTEQIPTNAAYHSEVTDFSKTYRPTEEEKAYSMSTEKAAQVEFSNDTIDDFLSERGLIYIASDNMSKFSFTSSSEAKKSMQSSHTSKTSKNNVVKSILSMFKRNSKVAPSSYPGIKKSGIDVELLHVSHASLYSSSNNSEYFKSLKRVKDSRSSF